VFFSISRACASEPVTWDLVVPAHCQWRGSRPGCPPRSGTASFPAAPGSPGACLHVHFVGSIPLPDAKTVLRTLAASIAPHLKPDGETGICKTWCAFCSKAIDVASDVPSFKFTQWDASCCAKYSAIEASHATRPDDCAPTTVKTHYADTAIESWGLSIVCSRKARSLPGSSSRPRCRPGLRRLITTWCRPTGRR
jgi:hypothetical protein